MTSHLARRALAEFAGTAFLVTAIMGSGIAAGDRVEDRLAGSESAGRINPAAAEGMTEIGSAGLDSRYR